MSNIDKQELREAAEKANPEQYGYYLVDAFTELATPATVLALLDELEAKDKRIDELKANNDSAHKALINVRHRTVTLPTGYSVRPGHPINETERSVMIPKDGGQWLSRFDVEHALRVAGIRINGED